MSLKLSRNINEICYPFIQEQSYLCDFEVITDEFCTLIGMAVSCMEQDENCKDILQDLADIQPLAFHINGSIRGRLAITEDDITHVEDCYKKYQTLAAPIHHAFILPRGTVPIPQLHACRSAAKKAIRAMVRVDEQNIAVPLELPRICNLLCNLFFVMTLVINKRRGITEQVFESLSYK